MRVLSASSVATNHTRARGPGSRSALSGKAPAGVLKLTVDVQVQTSAHIPRELYRDKLLIALFVCQVSGLDYPLFVRGSNPQIQLVSSPPHRHTSDISVISATRQDIRILMESTYVQIELEVKTKGAATGIEQAGFRVVKLDVLVDSVQQKGEASQGSWHQRGHAECCEIQ